MAPTNNNNKKKHIPFMHKYKQSKKCDKERLVSKNNRRKSHDTMHKTDSNRIKTYSFQSKPLTVPRGNFNTLRSNTIILRKAIVGTIINNIRQDVRNPGGYSLNKNVKDAVTCEGAENQYYSRNVSEEELKEKFPNKNFNSIGEDECFRYGYATGSGQSTIGKHADFNIIHKLTDEMEQLLVLDEIVLNLKTPEGIEKPTKFNAMSVKIYFYYHGLTMKIKKVEFHSDIAFKDGKSMSNNSQRPGSVVIIHTIGSNKVLKFQLHKIKGDNECIDGTSIQFDLKNNTRFLLHPLDEAPVFVTASTKLPRSFLNKTNNKGEKINAGKKEEWIENGAFVHWKHRAFMTNATKDGNLSFSLMSREVQKIALVDKNDVVVGHVNNDGDIIRHKREELPAYIQEQHDDYVTGERLNRFNNLRTKIKESESKF